MDSRWGWLAFTEMLAFLVVLLLGLVYVWRKKDLDWIKPASITPTVDTAIPLIAYNQINQEKYIPFQFKKTETVAPEIETVVAKPAFKPRFKKV